MKRSLLLMLMLSLSILAHGQQKGARFKLYQNTDMFKTECFDQISRKITRENHFNVTRFSLAVEKQSKKGYFHELELLIPEFGKPAEKLKFPVKYQLRKRDSPETEAASYSLRYEIYKQLGDDSAGSGFHFGLGINPYYVQLEYTPVIPNAYYSKVQLYGFALHATPRLYFRLSDRCSIDLNAPVRFYNLQREKNRLDDPLLPRRQQEHYGINHLFFEPAYTIRLGLRYTPN